jgi:hypothetical protein
VAVAVGYGGVVRFYENEIKSCVSLRIVLNQEQENHMNKFENFSKPHRRYKAMNIKRHIAVLAAVTGFWFSAEAPAAIMHFQIPLTGYQEVSGVNQFNNGDPDGFGVADLRIDTTALTVDWDFMVANIALELTGAHIHQAVAGTNGPIVVDFNAQLSGTGLGDPDLANVIANPHGFYVNLHNGEFPGGAIRGQICDPLPNPVPLPAAVWLLGSGLLGLIGVGRRRTPAA